MFIYVSFPQKNRIKTVLASQPKLYIDLDISKESFKNGFETDYGIWYNAGIENQNGKIILELLSGLRFSRCASKWERCGFTGFDLNFYLAEEIN